MAAGMALQHLTLLAGLLVGVANESTESEVSVPVMCSCGQELEVKLEPPQRQWALLPEWSLTL
jgi:hypothetical protein